VKRPLCSETGGTFASAVELIPINRATIVITHIDGDKFLDIAAVQSDQTHIILNPGGDSFASHSFTLDRGGLYGKDYPSSRSATDLSEDASKGFFNDDIYEDLVETPNLIRYNDGNGNYTDELVGFSFEGVSAGDFDSDGKDDLLIIVADSAKIYLNQYPDEPARSAALWVGSAVVNETTRKRTVVDLDHNGDLDFALVIPLDDGSDESLISWALGNGDGSISSADSIRVVGVAYNLVAVDATKDHNLDLVIVNSTTRELEIYPGDGLGHFDDPITVEMSAEDDLTSILAVIDKNRDGQYDFVSGSSNSGEETYPIIFVESQQTGTAVQVDKMVTTGYSNASLSITNPNGFVISQHFTTVASSDYQIHDANNDGLLDEETYDYNVLEGEYSITIKPRPGRDPGDPFSMGILVDDQPQNILFQDYSMTTSAKFPSAFSASSTDSIVFYYEIEYSSSIQPGNGVPTTNVQPTLDWTALASNLWPTATTYHLQFDEDYYFGSPTYDDATLTTPSFAIPSPLGVDAVYYWRVEAFEGAAWSGFWRTFALYIKFGCCSGIRGNTNGDAGENINISDITYLVDRLFGRPELGPPPPCLEEGNVNGDPENYINISDITYLVEHLFGIPLGPAPPPCP